MYYLDIKEAALSSVSDDVSILACGKANGNKNRLAGK
jgi:hypothetical protein